MIPAAQRDAMWQCRTGQASAVVIAASPKKGPPPGGGAESNFARQKVRKFAGRLEPICKIPDG
eukprot:14508166-Alexandrium_andersonii.AAC.1